MRVVEAIQHIQKDSASFLDGEPATFCHHQLVNAAAIAQFERKEKDPFGAAGVY